MESASSRPSARRITRTPYCIAFFTARLSSMPTGYVRGNCSPGHGGIAGCVSGCVICRDQCHCGGRSPRRWIASSCSTQTVWTGSGSRMGTITVYSSPTCISPHMVSSPSVHGYRCFHCFRCIHRVFIPELRLFHYLLTISARHVPHQASWMATICLPSVVSFKVGRSSNVSPATVSGNRS
jgi:hypothetical protein